MPNKTLHPETSSGEVFFSNMNTAQFGNFVFTTKRKGNIAYDGEGNRLSATDWFPVFISENELSKHQQSLTELRRLFRGEVNI